MRKNYFFTVLIAITGVLFSCKKSSDAPPVPQPEMTISIEPSEVLLSKQDFFIGKRLKVKLTNVPKGETGDVVWKVDNAKVAKVDEEGSVWALAAGRATVTATLVSGKGFATCKVTVTDADDYKIRITLKDKGTPDFSISDPTAFLSAKAIERRRKRNIPIDETDLPISKDYLQRIEGMGGKIVATSKWLNTVTVTTSNEFSLEHYKSFPFVKEVVLVGANRRVDPPPTRNYVDKPQIVSNHTATTKFDYGEAFSNIHINNGEVLHQKGFKGAGIDIAVIDAGFLNMNNNPFFKNVNIKGAKSFVYENDNPYAIDNHGVWVTSCMAVNKPGDYVGTAPEASYWLLRTEDSATEYPVEEDYWVSAAEFADSVGVDIINSSLTYSDGYPAEYGRYKESDMDGKTAFATRGANVAAQKGILIVNCAGNEQKWVGTPADSKDLLTVGSVNSNRGISLFTSWGYTGDGRLKPDVMAQGALAAVISPTGEIENRSGTSYASPILCGLAACLWQAYPTLTNVQIIEIMRKAGDRAAKPDLQFGWGIVNMQKAMELAAAAGK